MDIYRSNNSGPPLSAIMADIDRFKQINDTYGHLSGDEVLKEFAHCITQSVRRRFDWVARYGGDESPKINAWASILNRIFFADQKAAYEVAKKIRLRIEAHAFIFGDTLFRVTASFGGYTLQSETPAANKLINLADRNLYKSRNADQNQTVYE